MLSIWESVSPFAPLAVMPSAYRAESGDTSMLSSPGAHCWNSRTEKSATASAPGPATSTFEGSVAVGAGSTPSMRSSAAMARAHPARPSAGDRASRRPKAAPSAAGKRRFAAFGTVAPFLRVALAPADGALSRTAVPSVVFFIGGLLVFGFVGNTNGKPVLSGVFSKTGFSGVSLRRLGRRGRPARPRTARRRDGSRPWWRTRSTEPSALRRR